MNTTFLNTEMQQETDVTQERLCLIQLSRLATWLFIMGSFLYLYSFDEEEKSLVTNSKDEALSYQKSASKAVVEGSSLFLVSIIILTIISWEKLQILRKDLSTDPLIIEGQLLVFKFNLIKVLGFAGATAGYITIVEGLESD